MKEYKRTVPPPVFEEVGGGETDFELSAAHVAKAYATMAESFLDMYMVLWAVEDRRPDDPVAKSYILTHSVELALKAFLLINGVGWKELRAVEARHDIDRLMDWAEDFELPLAFEARAAIRSLSPVHRNFRNRYPSSGNFGFLSGPAFVFDVRSIIDLVKESPAGT